MAGEDDFLEMTYEDAAAFFMDDAPEDIYAGTAVRDDPDVPDGDCEMCGEPADVETGLFWDDENQRQIFAHAQCGADAGMKLA